MKPRGSALRVSFPRKNTTLSLSLSLSRERSSDKGTKRKEDTKMELGKERKKQTVGQEGTRLSLRHPGLSRDPSSRLD